MAKRAFATFFIGRITGNTLCKDTISSPQRTICSFRRTLNFFDWGISVGLRIASEYSFLLDNICANSVNLKMYIPLVAYSVCLISIDFLLKLAKSLLFADKNS